MQMFPGDLSTFGGLVCDVHARVLRGDGSAIEGLYATGTSTASVMGAVEGGPGGSIGPTMTWAWLAGRPCCAMGISDRSTTMRRASSTMRRSEENTSELESLMRIAYAAFCL